MAVVAAVVIFTLMCTCRASSPAPACGVRGPKSKVGSRANEPVVQIFRGNKAQPHEFPWMVALLLNPGSEFLCGGVIINEDYVITAAHCIESDPSPSSYLVVVGGYNRSTTDPNDIRKVSAVSESNLHC